MYIKNEQQWLAAYNEKDIPTYARLEMKKQLLGTTVQLTVPHDEYSGLLKRVMIYEHDSLKSGTNGLKNDINLMLML